MTGPFRKEVYIRLTDDGRGFLYTVKYGCLRLPTRKIEPFGAREISLGIEAPVPADRNTAQIDAHQTLKVERHFGAA